MRIARLCKEFNCLPWLGGLLQQPKDNILKLEAVMNADNRFTEYKDKTRPKPPETPRDDS